MYNAFTNSYWSNGEWHSGAVIRNGPSSSASKQPETPQNDYQRDYEAMMEWAHQHKIAPREMVYDTKARRWFDVENHKYVDDPIVARS